MLSQRLRTTVLENSTPSAQYRIGLYTSKCFTIKEKGKKEMEIQKE
jgi:hypothetical protein